MRRPSDQHPLSPALVEALALERNTALMAGAGAGKTYSLVTICLHLLSGARRRAEPLRPTQLYLMTFTDKAAGELRDRLRRRVEDLATGRKDGEPEVYLRDAFERLGRPFPPRDVWRQLRDDLGAAFIGTFHSLCVQLLRRAPPGFGVEPAFELLDEREAGALLKDVAERVVLDAVDRGDPHVSELCRELNFSGLGRAGGLVDELIRVFTRVREEGVDPASVEITDARAARAEFDQALAAVKAAFAQVQAAREKKTDTWQRALGALAGCLPGLTFESFHATSGFAAVERAFLGTTTNVAASLKAAVAALKYGCLGHKQEKVSGLLDLHASCAVAAHEEAFRKLLCALRVRHQRELDRRAALDFSELLIRTRDLLRDHPAVRREVQSRIGALLVDEFQDTNRLQLEIVMMLAEQREGAARTVTTGEQLLALPLEPAFVCAVGDRKQSIYEFRGADVSVFELLARQIEHCGGARAFLRTNHRSSEPLLGFFNQTFADLMQSRPEPRDYEVVYTPEHDDLLAWRRLHAPGPCVERLVFDPPEGAEEARLAEADFLAARIKALLAPGAPAMVVERDDTIRPPRGGDIALLFRAFTQLELYRQALIRHGIPHRVVGGRGFYSAQEVLDLASLLALVADPGDLLSLTAVLRSPLVGLSDPSLFRLAGVPEARLSMERVADPELRSRSGLTELELRRLERFLRVFPRLRSERDRLGLRLLLKVALEELGYRPAIAGTSFGEQALANLDKLLELAGHWDDGGLGGCEAFARELTALAQSEPREEQADTLDAEDPRAVQLLTIHRAKGLEWPLVIVPDLASKRPPIGGAVLYDRQRGLALRPLLPDGGSVDSPRLKAIRAELTRRQDAESQRLLYVALTRARDRLILSGQRDTPEGWRRQLDALIEARGAEALGVVDLRPDALPSAPPPAPADPPDGAAARARGWISQARTPVRPSPAAVTFPVTQLQDFFRCPRRYRYLHQIGLSEAPMILELPEERTPDEGGAFDPRARGTLAHRLLERVSYEQVAAGGKKLEAHLRALLGEEGVAPDQPGAAELLGEVRAFLRTRFGAKLSALDPARVHRELPFLLRLGEGRLHVHLKGQIDLLIEDEDGGATIVDYKFARAPEQPFLAYGFQLDCYALAARHLVHEGVPVRTGLAFLKGGPREPDFRQVPSEAELAALEARLVEGAERLLEAVHTGQWPGLQSSGCQALRCGYQYRCHPVATGL